MSPATHARSLLTVTTAAAERMAATDAMTPEFRALANEYGAGIVCSILDDDAERGEATTPEEAADALAVYRETRQRALLALDVRLSKPKTAKAIADATMRRAKAKGRPAAPRTRYVEAEALPGGAHLFNDLGL